jgi:hypothetical protein
MGSLTVEAPVAPKEVCKWDISHSQSFEDAEAGSGDGTSRSLGRLRALSGLGGGTGMRYTLDRGMEVTCQQDRVNMQDQ